MANPVQTSLEQEFNRLNFLASIATRTTDPDGNSIKAGSVKLTQVTTMSPSVASSANGMHYKDHKSTSSSQVNGLNSKTSLGSSISNIGKINSLLINTGNPSPVSVSSFQLRNNNASLRMVTKAGPTHINSNSGLKDVSQTRPHMQPTRAVTPTNIIPRSHATMSPLKNNLKSAGMIPKGTSNFSVQSSSIGSAQMLTEEQKRIILSGVNILQNNSSSTTTVVTTTQNLSTPLILSQSQPSLINSQTRIIAQTPVSSTTGQTILLPANFAGMSGKVFIVSNPGKVPQAIALTTAASKVAPQQHTIVSSQNFTTNNTINNKKPVLLVPNTISAKSDKQTNNIAFSNVNHQVTSIQPHQTVNHTLQLLTAGNSSSPQLKIQGQPVSMTSFQNIRPKAILSAGRTIQPKTTISNAKSDTNTLDVRLSHFPTGTSLFNNKQSTSVAISLVSMSLPVQTTKTSTTVPLSNKKGGQVSTNTNQVLMSQFDKTMSQHLQTLQKTDPHLFLQNGNKLVINQTQRPLSLLDKNIVSQTQNKIQKKQGKSLASNVHQTTVQLPQIPSNSRQQASKSQFSVTQQIALATQQVASSSSTVNITPQQLLTMPQKQQANLQNIIKQQLMQQQQQQLLQNKGLSGKIQIVQPTQQSAASDSIQVQQQLQLQQQQLKASQQGSSQPQLFLMQQKILQPRQQKTQMVNSPLTSHQQQQIMQAQQQIAQSNNLKNSQSIANAQPLKLLSSLTSNMVKSAGNIVQPPTMETQINQQGIRPILVQLPSGAHMLQTAQLTSSQILELQKHIMANSGSPNKRLQQSVQNIIPQNSTRLSVPSAISAPVTSSSISSAARIAIQNLQNPSASSLKSAFASQASMKSKQQNTLQFVNQAKYAPALKDGQIINNKSLQEHLKNLSAAQCELFLKQYASGKLTLGKQNVTNPTLLASILKKKQLEATKSAIAASQSMLGSPMQKKSDSHKAATRQTKRPIEVAKKEPDEHPFSKRWKGSLQTDQLKYVSPNYKTPFNSRNDAIERLLPFHVSQHQPSEPTKDQQHELLYQAYSRNVQDRKFQMIEKLNLLMLKEAQIEVPTCEDILIGRLYVASEKEAFQQQKKAVADGALIVKNQRNDGFQCVEMTAKEDPEPTPVSLDLTGHKQLDNRFLIARKDISNIDSELNNDDEEEDDDDDGADKMDEDEGDDIDDVVYGYNDDFEPVEEIEVEEISKMDFIRDDNELAAATSNLLADLEESEDFLLDF